MRWVYITRSLIYSINKYLRQLETTRRKFNLAHLVRYRVYIILFRVSHRGIVTCFRLYAILVTYFLLALMAHVSNAIWACTSYYMGFLKGHLQILPLYRYGNLLWALLQEILVRPRTMVSIDSSSFVLRLTSLISDYSRLLQSWYKILEFLVLWLLVQVVIHCYLV